MLGRRLLNSGANAARAFSTAAAPSSSGAPSVAQRGTTAINYRVIRFPPTRTPGYGANTHRSNRAKNGLYHGKDIQFGHSVSHSQVKSKRRWYPNVINKRVWSDALGDWVRFKMTTRALREIDNVGGIDTYLLALEEKQVTDSNYVTKMRRLIGSALYHRGALDQRLTKKLGFDKTPPALESSGNCKQQEEGANESAHLQ